MAFSLDSITTVERGLTAVHDYFEQHDLYYGHGTDNAWDEAVALMCAVMQFPPDVSDAVLTKSISCEQREQLVKLAQQRVEQRIPLAYLCQQAWFMGLPFYVDERVLIPRSPFAELIVNRFSPWVRADEVTRILEVGTGSGCMAIAAAKQFPNAKVVATDLSLDALQVAQKNAQQHQVLDQVTLLQSDVYTQVQGQYDIIMSNPPYVGAVEMQTLPEEYRHEPKGALEALDNGLDIVTSLLTQAVTYLAPGGILVVEVGNSEPLVQQRYPKLPLVWLEFEHGGFGVFLVTKEQLLAYFKESH